jgi:hypothetical protein
VKYISKYGTGKLWNSGEVELWDFSRANENKESRIEAIAQVASICYGKPPKDAKKLVERLWKESGGLPSSAFEFVRPGPGIDFCTNHKRNTITYSFRNKPGNINTYEDASLYYRLVVGDQNLREEPLKTMERHHRNAIATFKLKVPIFIARQVMRHRTFSYQELCLSGESKISTSKGKRTIESLYLQRHKKGTDGRIPQIRVYNLDTKLFEYASGEPVFAGNKKMYELAIIIANGKRRTIKASENHRFLTKNGWKPLKELSPGDFVATNGKPIWRDKEFLKQKKTEFLKQGIGMKGMSERLGINYNTLKKWMRRFGLQYTPLEVASTFTIWNKGMFQEKSHMWGKTRSKKTRQLASDALTKDFLITQTGFRKRAASYWSADFRREPILKKYNYQCAKCGAKDNLEIDHIKPISQYPELAFDPDNVQILCHKCHAEKSVEENAQIKTTAKYNIINSIKFVGIEPAYDLHIDHESHNYVADDFIVHNSRRYTTGKQVAFDWWFTDEQDTYPGTDGIRSEAYAHAEVAYRELLDRGERPEVARSVLPVGFYTEFWMMGDIPAWQNYFKLRLDSHTQKEHRQLAESMLDLLEEHQYELWNEVRPGDEHEINRNAV